MMFRSILIISVIVASAIGIFFPVSASAEQVSISGEELLSTVSNAVSDALVEADTNLTEIAGAFSVTDSKKTTADAIIGKNRIENPGWGGVVLLADGTTLTSLNTSLIPDPLNEAVLKDKAVTDSITYLKPKMSKDRIVGNSVQAIMISRPAIVNDKAGAAIGFMVPAQYLNGIVQPLINDTDAMSLVMQDDGTILYASSPMELTKIPPENILTEAPTYRDVKNAMMTEKSGHMIYEFWHGDQNDPRAREAYWNTVSLHGTEWRVLVAPAIR